MFGFFSQSSTSTNLGDFEEFYSLPNAEKVKSQGSPTYDLRSRTVKKVQGRRKTQSDTPKAGSSRRQRKAKKNHSPADNETEIYSQESVSMLQECYRRSSKVRNVSTDEENENILNAAENPHGRMNFIMDKSNQAKFPFLLDIQEVTKRAKFIKCIVNLKFVLSFKDKRVNASLCDIINTVKSDFEEMLGEVEAEEGDATLLKETTNEYISRLPDFENEFCETVETILSHLESTLEENFLEVAGCWRNSVYELAVDLLNEAVNCKLEIRNSIKSFLFRLLNAILNNEEGSKNLVLESRAMIVLKFCRSTSLSFSLISHMIGQLKPLNKKLLGFSSLAEKLFWSSFVRNLHILLRVLEVCLESVKSRLDTEEIDEVLNEEEEAKTFNVLEMWRKHWRADETSRKAKTDCQETLMLIRWFNELDQVLINCVSHFPISAMAVDRCKRLVMEILKICNSEKSKRAENLV